MSIIREQDKNIDISELISKFQDVKISKPVASNLKDGDGLEVGSVSAHLGGNVDPMFLFERTRVARAVLFIIGIRRQETAWGLKAC